MPRRRFRDPDPQVRDRNMLDILGAPGLSGLSRVGGLSGGSQTANLIVRGDGGDGGLGVQIEHVTLYAVTSQTIANGGGTVQFDTTAGAPTQIRGFDTLQTNLASSGSVGDIPVDVTGVLNFILEGRWTSWRATGDLTVVKTDSYGQTEQRTYTLDRFGVASDVFGGDDDGWEVEAGDTMTYQLPNGSGSGQTLAEATLVQKIIGVASAASGIPQLDETLWYDIRGASATSTVTLTAGKSYSVRITGNFEVSPGEPASYLDEIMFPSDGFATHGATHDYDTEYSPSSVSHYTTVKLDLGSGFSHVEPRGGPYSTYQSDHVYVVDVVGEGSTLSITKTDVDRSDNNGQLKVEIFGGTL